MEGEEVTDRFLSRVYVVTQIVAGIATAGVIVMVGYKVMGIISNLNKDENVNAAQKKLAKTLKRPELQSISLTKHEAMLCDDIICCDDIEVGFSNVGGMEGEIECIRDNIITPMKMWSTSLHSKMSSIQPCPTGMLLCKFEVFFFFYP